MGNIQTGQHDKHCEAEVGIHDISLLICDDNLKKYCCGEISEKNERMSESVTEDSKEKVRELKNKISTLEELQLHWANDFENFQDIIKKQQEELGALKIERRNLLDSLNQHNTVEAELDQMKVERGSWQAKEEVLRATLDINVQAISCLEEEIKSLESDITTYKTKDVIGLLPKLIHPNVVQTMEKNKLFKLEDSLQQCILMVANAKRELEKKQSEEALCCVCLEGEKTILVLPCKHLCMCKACSEKEAEVCPACKGRIDTKIGVFM